MDELRKKEGPGAAPLVAVSQGVHLVLPRRFLPGAAALMVPKTDDGWVLFAVPWHDRVIVGTTDSPRPKAEAEPVVTDEEREFVLRHARRHLAERPSEADVLGAFAGLRPLVRGKAGAATAGLSREHAMVEGAGGMLTVTGGKWTTYREMAEQVVDRAAAMAGLAARPCGTAELTLHGAGGPAAGETDAMAVYGADAEKVREAGAATRLHPALPYSEAEVRWAVREEMAQMVEDVLARRTRALWLDARAAGECAARVAQILAGELGKDAGWAGAQAEDFARRVTEARGGRPTGSSGRPSEV